jgi:hypothetical protein
MVKATFVLSALIALTAAVSAAPFLEDFLENLVEEGLINVEAEDHIGTGDVDIRNVANGAGQVKGVGIYGNCI